MSAAWDESHTYEELKSKDDVMKQDAVGAVRSHNTVIFEDSTVWIFFPSSPYQDLPIMSNSSARVCLHYLPFTPTPNQRL